MSVYLACPIRIALLVIAGILFFPGKAFANSVWPDDCDGQMSGQSTFARSEVVCVTGDLDYSCGAIGAEGDIYVVQTGDPDPFNAVTPPTRHVSMMGAGAFISVAVWLPTLQFGTYDLVLDEHCDRLLTGSDLRIVAAFQVVGCGDGLVQSGEECDDGGESASCDVDCSDAICGDGIVNVTASEDCEENGETATCDADCTFVACGDGSVNATAAEECDGSGETATCDADCTHVVCGDRTINVAAGEECDDGNQVSLDGCSGTCFVEAGWVCDASPGEPCRLIACGDGIQDGDEECDNGGESSVCDADCSIVVCGDGTVNASAGEQCDDGNAIDGDGCSSTCLVEQMVDGGSGDAGGSSDGGSSDGGSSDGGSSDGGSSDGGSSDADPPGGCSCQGGQAPIGPNFIVGILVLFFLLCGWRQRRD